MHPKNGSSAAMMEVVLPPQYERSEPLEAYLNTPPILLPGWSLVCGLLGVEEAGNRRVISWGGHAVWSRGITGIVQIRRRGYMPYCVSCLP